MSEHIFLLPDLGEGLTEAELVRWLVDTGDTVAIDQPVAEVETAKSVVEVPSPFAGTVAVLHGQSGQTMEVGKPLLTVTSDTSTTATPTQAAHLAYREEEKAGSGNVLIGYGTSGEVSSGRKRQPKRAAVPTPEKPNPAQPLSAQSSAAQPSAAISQAGEDHAMHSEQTRATGLAPLVISPIVRKIARDAGLHLSEVIGSGPDGLILRRDVEAALSGASAGNKADQRVDSNTEARDTSAPQTAGVPSETDTRSGLPIVSRTPLTGVRKTIANAMSRSRTEIPEATVWVDVDATALVTMRADLKKKLGDDTPSLLALIARFTLAGLAKFPEMNTRIDSEAILAVEGVNLGIAVNSDRGLMVPSIPAAHLMSARELDTEIKALSAVVRQGQATPAQLTRGTFTLNNYGVFGVDGSAAIINYPEAAILGVGRIMDKPWVVDGELAVRKVCELTLTFDHRVCDGGVAGGFLRYVADAIESPGSALIDL